MQTVRWEAERAVRTLGVQVTAIVAVHGADVPGRQLHIEGVTVVNARRLRRTLQQLPHLPWWDADHVQATVALADQKLPTAA